MVINSTDIGARIRAARKSNGLSQTELASLLGKTMRTVQKYESGEIEPSIAMINEIAKVLGVEFSGLMGYTPSGRRDYTLADVIAFIRDMGEKSGIRFEVDVQRPPQSNSWSCSLRFDGGSAVAPLNSDVCLFLEAFRDQRERLESYWSTREQFDEWVDHQIAYHAQTELKDRAIEEISEAERIRRRDALVAEQLERAKQKAAGQETSGADEQ